MAEGWMADGIGSMDPSAISHPPSAISHQPSAISHDALVQYALANQASALAGLSQRTHDPGGTLAVGMLRIVACVSVLIRASQSAAPHHGAMTKPGRPSIISLNSAYEPARCVCSSRNCRAR